MKKKVTFAEKFIGYTIAAIVGALILLWYNYVLLQGPLRYWQAVVFFVTFIVFVPTKLAKWIVTPVFLICIFSQLACWFGWLTLPLFK